VEDQFGHAALEESYVSDGTGATSSDRRIDRKTHDYTNGRLVASHQNGRLVYEAAYNPDGTLQWEEDDSGQRTEYTYDEMKWVHQKMIRGRGGDADQVLTYDYDVFGNRISETRTAGGLSAQSRWIYNFAGELTATVGIDGLTNFVSASYTNGFKVVTESLPTLATTETSYFKDRQPRSVTGTAVEDEFYDYSAAAWAPGSYREARSLYRDSARTQLKQTRMVNWLGNEILLRTLQFKGIGNRDRYTYYDADANSQTRAVVTEVTETGRATQLFTYDELARLSAQGLDLNTNGVLDAASTEPITTFDRQFSANTNGVWEDVSTVQRYLQDNVGVPTLLQRKRTTVPAALSTNLAASNIVERVGGGIAVSFVTLERSSGERTTTVNDQELGQVRTSVVRDGLLRLETPPGISTPHTYSYTPLGELETVADPVTGNVTNAYEAVTRRLMSVTDSLARTTIYDYYPAGATNAGRLKGIQDANGNWTYFDYTPAGLLFRRWGANTYPIEQLYDGDGGMTNMMTFRTSGGPVNWAASTWPNPPPGDVTQWVYDQSSGLLERKICPDGGMGAKAVIYTYDAGHFLDTKTNGREQVADYTVDTAGRLRGISYSDGTPPVTLDYDRAGRLRSVADAAGTHNISWTDRDQTGDETYTAGLLSGVAVTRGYDTQFRLATLGLSLGGTPTTRQRFAYDSISWLDYIADVTPDDGTVLHEFDYAFRPNTPFVQNVDFFRGTNAVMTQTYNRDNLGRLAGASATLAGGETVSGVNYQFDNLDRRYEADLADGTKWNYGYNDRSETTFGKKHLPSGAYAGGQQFEYGFDDIGNRTSTKVGGNQSGAGLRPATYTPNALNQYNSREVPGSVWLTGEAPTNLTLQGVVGGQVFAVQRQDGEQFFAEAQVNNGATSVFARVTVLGTTNGTLNDVETGHHFVAQTPENFAYDADGNLTQDGRWTYTWDAENRLVRLTARSNVPDSAKRKVDFVYDSQGRRVQKVTSTWNGSAYVAQSTNKFVYDGWNLIAVVDSGLSLQISYNWGLDVSGTTQGAGGVGGLLVMSVNNGPEAGTYYYNFDGNGNVMTLVNAMDTTLAALQQTIDHIFWKVLSE